MEHVTSRDGTHIAYQRLGEGPPVIIIGGGLSDHTGGLPLAEELSTDLTAVVVDRRARGQSGDRTPGIVGSVEREVEDLAALIEAVGGRATLVGASSGAVLCLAAAAHDLPVDRLVLFEPPFATEQFPPVAPPDMPEQLAALVAQGRDTAAVELFLTRAVGLPAEMVEGMKQGEAWSAMAAFAPSTVYDAALTRRYPHAEAFTSVTTPSLVLHGEGTWPLLAASAAALAAALPGSQLRTLAGGDHRLDVPTGAAAIRELVD